MAIKKDQKQRIQIPCGDCFIVAEVTNYDGDHPEICITLDDANGNVCQDIAVVRPHNVIENVLVGYFGTITEKAPELDTEKVDVLVYADAFDENYTNKFVVEKYREEE